MPFSRPSLTTDLIPRIQGDLDGRFPGADSRLRRSPLGVLGRVLAGVANGLYGYLADMADQLMVDTADTDHLDRHASIWGLPRKAATPAAGPALVPGTEGSDVPVGTLLQTADGTEYATTADATVTGGVATLTVQASVPGVAGQAIAGTTLSLVSPVPGVAASGQVAQPGLAGGADEETDDELRARVLARIQAPPAGGKADDYVAWALAVPGVTRAWVLPAWMGLGTVGLTIMMDDRPDPLPQPADVAAVDAYVEPLRPVTAALTVFAPTTQAVSLTIQLSPNTAVVQTAVAAELADFFRREAAPGGVVYRSRLDEAISAAAGEYDHLLLTPQGNVYMPQGVLPVLGVIQWQG